MMQKDQDGCRGEAKLYGAVGRRESVLVEFWRANGFSIDSLR